MGSQKVRVVENNSIQGESDAIRDQTVGESGRSRFICLTNIPTPYRLHFFNALSAELERRGWSFEVWFMARSEPGRYWRFQPEEFKFQYRFLYGMSFKLFGAVFHLNLGVASLLRKTQPNVLLLAGSWGLPTNVITTLRARALNKATLLFWSESHEKSIKFRNWLVNKLRSWLLPAYDGFAVPGRFASDYVRHYAPNRPIYTLANTVNESVFRDKVLGHRDNKSRLRDDLGIPAQNRILLLPARLSSEKGIVPFLSAISSLSASATRDISILIAGDGPLRELLEKWVDQHRHLDVRNVGHVKEDEMAKLYGLTDTVALPSLLDPNPLSVIEALWAGLPLILSDRVGNHPEALLPGENGWLFDPESSGATRDVMKDWAATDSRELERRGKASTRIAEERFRTETVLKNFLDQVLI